MLTFKLLFKISLFFLILSANAANIKKIEIVDELPHSRASFTQGFVYDQGFLIESTGAPDNRVSKIYKINVADGIIKQVTDIPQVFAEGITKFNNELKLLTWKSGIAFHIDYTTLAISGQVNYSGEGWGLTTDGSVYFMSNGSDTLYIRDADFGIIGTVPVRLNGVPVRGLNELEFVKGYMFANQWYSDKILEIDISSGKVVSEIDCSALRAKCQGVDKHDVLNGIAYNAKEDIFYLTGKDWPKIFKVKIK